MKLSFVPQTFFRIFFVWDQDRDQDQDNDFSLDFDTRPTFHTNHQILFGSANSFESYCVHVESPRTYS